MGTQVPAAEQTLAILRVLAAAPGPMPAARIAHYLGIPRSSTYQLLRVMAEHGFVAHLAEERLYGLGVSVFEVGSAYLRHDPLERLSRPVLRELVRDVRAGPTAVASVGQVGVLHGRETLYIAKESVPGAPTLVTAIGVRLPAHLTASGRAMLAALPRAQVRALFPSAEQFVDRTGVGPDSPTRLRQLLDQERRRGWATEDGEVTEGYASVAAAVNDHTGRPTASISLTFRASDLPRNRWAELAPAVQAASALLAHRLNPASTTGATRPLARRDRRTVRFKVG